MMFLSFSTILKLFLAFRSDPQRLVDTQKLIAPRGFESHSIIFVHELLMSRIMTIFQKNWAPNAGGLFYVSREKNITFNNFLSYSQEAAI